MPVRMEIAMGTLVRVEVPASGREVDHVVERTFFWFREIESRCSRFDEESQLRRVSAHIGFAIRVRPILYEVVQFARLVAETTGGAFDPPVGPWMEMRGFDRYYRTGEIAAKGEPVDAVTWRDGDLNPGAHTILLSLPLTLDLGGIAKRFAVDLAARELAPFRNFAIDSGGDLYHLRTRSFNHVA
jgi:thiamine biosynthesis lipoprotein